MGELKLNWKVYEKIGVAMVNPMIYIYEIVNRNIDKDTITKDNIRELIKICFDQVPNRKERILEIIETKLPQFKDEIQKYRILL